MAEAFELWDVICDGPFVPTKTSGDPVVNIPKTRKDFNDANRKAIEKNFRAKKILVCGIDPDEYNKISACQSAKEIWEALQIAHEGTTQVKQSKIDMLTTEYELFRMKEDESIQDMHTHFTSIINELHSLGEIIPRNKLVRKILSVLPSSWESKVNAITEAKDLQKQTIDELISNLKTNGGIPKRDSSSKTKYYDLCHKCGKPGHFIKDCPLLKQDQFKHNTDKAVKRNPVPDKRFKRKNVADSVVKQALAAWGDSSSESEEDNDHGDSSMMAVEREAEQSRDGLVVVVVDLKETIESLKEEKDALTEKVANLELERDDLVVVVVDLKETIESLEKEKDVLIKRVASIEHERDDLLVVVVDLKDTIEELKGEGRHEILQKGKEVVDEIHLRLEDEIKSVKSSLCAELENNKQLQEELGRVKSDLEKSLKWTWSSDVITSMYTNNGGNKQGIETCKAKFQSQQKNKVFAKKRAVKGSSQQWYMDSDCSKNMTGSTNDFLSLKALQGESVAFGNGKKGYILGVGRIGKSLSHSIENVYYVNGLKHSLLSVSQIYDKGNKVEFVSKICTVTNLVTGEVVLMAKRYKNIYIADFESLQSGDLSCLRVVDDDTELWHRRLGHASFSLLNKLVQKDLIRGLPKSSFKEYKIQVKMEGNVACIRSDHGKEFDNAKFDEFCVENGTTHNFSTPRTPQQNSVVERKNMTLKDMARTMLIDSGIAKTFWAEAVNTACYLINMCMIRSLLNKTPDELLNGRMPKLTHLRTFGCKCFVLNNGKEALGKFDAKSDEGIFLGYSTQSKAYKADMMSHVKESSKDDATTSPSIGEEPGPTNTTIEAENIDVDAVQGTPLVEIRSNQEHQSDILGSSTNEVQEFKPGQKLETHLPSQPFFLK
ncbi:uncharacterized protein LOC107760425 [Nicotiana tabacum]|uniref:Uncharacterized protein LOC107760425 n=1 Tax=Nicotiana tabacum TaxID=4097 RepID=A0AC58UBY6_TOBAC